MSYRVPSTPGQQRRLCYLACYRIARLSPRHSRLSAVAYAFRVGHRLNKVLS